MFCLSSADFDNSRCVNSGNCAKPGYDCKKLLFILEKITNPDWLV